VDVVVATVTRWTVSVLQRGFGYRVTHTRSTMVWTVMLVTIRLQRQNTGTKSARARSTRRAARSPPHLPFELWNLTLGFLNHDVIPGAGAE
jgi:hypothetical protein